MQAKLWQQRLFHQLREGQLLRARCQVAKQAEAGVGIAALRAWRSLALPLLEEHQRLGVALDVIREL